MKPTDMNLLASYALAKNKDRFNRQSMALRLWYGFTWERRPVLCAALPPKAVYRKLLYPLSAHAVVWSHKIFLN